MICPKCGKVVSQESIKCPNCQFNFNEAFKEFIKREKKIHSKIIRVRINKDKQIYDQRIKVTDKLFKITSQPNFKYKLSEYNISPEEWNCLEFKLVSKIYLNKITKKSDLNYKINLLLSSYDGEYKFKIDILSKNLTNLINLAGINPFSKYYYYQLNDFKLSIVEGLEVLGYVIEDLYGKIEFEDLDVKIKDFMKQTVENPQRKKYEDQLNNAIEEYFILTGKDYISFEFERKLIKHDFSIKDVYNIKERFLKKIILDGTINNLDKKLDNIISEYFTKSKSVYILEDKEVLHLVGDSYSYYDSMKIGKRVYRKNNKSSKPKKKRKRKNKSKRKRNVNHDNFIPIKLEELGSDDNSYEDQINFEKEILGDY